MAYTAGPKLRSWGTSMIETEEFRRSPSLGGHFDDRAPLGEQQRAEGVAQGVRACSVQADALGRRGERALAPVAVVVVGPWSAIAMREEQSVLAGVVAGPPIIREVIRQRIEQAHAAGTASLGVGDLAERDRLVD